MSGKTRIFVAGHLGMVGSAIQRALEKREGVEVVTRERSDLDLTKQLAVATFFENESIDQVYLAAGKVGGIHANNTYPAEFIYENMMIEANVIHQAHLAGVHRLLFLGSSCIYPRMAEQPIHESALLTGALEATNEPYAIAKIAGIKLCESYNRQYGRDYRSVMPTNLYGPNDNFALENSHVIPALLRRFHEAKVQRSETVTIWGTGNAQREFMHVDDLAAAAIFVADLPEDALASITEPMLSHINAGTGIDCTIRELALTLKEVTGYEGEIAFDTSRPDGTPRKLLDTSKLSDLGWQPDHSLQSGLEDTYRWFCENLDHLRVG